MATHQHPKWDYKEYPKTLPADDLWGQVRRTVHGKAVPAEEIEKIVQSIREGLLFRNSDVLLDIGCGNGALSQKFFDDCAEIHGVDSSEYLISVANQKFSSDRHSFECIDVDGYVERASNPLRFTLALCYGAIGYFSDESVGLMFRQLHQKFRNVRRVYIGSIPNPARAKAFYGDSDFNPEDLLQHQSQIGCWRSPEYMVELATAAGWSCEYQAPAVDFYQAHYRYNFILKRDSEVEL